MATASSSLAVRETILGVLKGKDVAGIGNIHSSDFRTAVSDLGFPMGSQIVEDILVHCRVDPRTGNIDFSGLERELERERRVVNSKPKEDKTKTVSTSRGIKQSPWRADVLHNEKLQAETQSRRVGENRKEVHEIYKQFVNHEYDADETVGHLQALGIEPTQAFRRLLNENSACAEIKFADFTRSLVIYDPRNSNGIDLERPAGAKHPSQRPQVTNVPEVDAELFPQFRRKNPAVLNAATLINKPPDKYTDATNKKALKTGKKMTLDIDPQTGQISSRFKSSHVMKQTAFASDNSQQLVSHAHSDLQTGVLGDEIPLKYTSELKIVREQVLAALRKLDSGELTLPEFQGLVFDMGFELPEVIVKELRRSAHSGMLNWKKCVEILDAEVFKVHALYERVLPEQVEAAKQALLEALLNADGGDGGGANALSNLAAAFRKMDSNGDGSLSLNELKAGFMQYGVEISDEDVRILFNAFDTSGDGMLSVSEFLVGLRGEVSAPRLNTIRGAFQRLNRTGTPTVPIETVVDNYDASVHPDVLSGIKTERQVVNELCVALTSNGSDSNNSNNDGSVCLEAFEEFFSNLSVNYRTDREFIQFIGQSFNINDRKAPPPLQANLKARGSKDPTVLLPKAKQFHGDCITWSQDRSELEEEGEKFDQTRRGIIQHHNKVSTFVVSSKAPASADVKAKEFKAAGGHSISQTGMTNASDKSLLAWNSKRVTNKATSPGSKASTSKGNNSSDDTFVHPADVLYSKDSTAEDSRGFLFSSYSWSPTKLAHLAKPSPFDVNPDHDMFASTNRGRNSAGGGSGSGSGSSNTPKSLSSLLGGAGGRGSADDGEGGSAVKPKQLKTLLDHHRERDT